MRGRRARPALLATVTLGLVALVGTGGCSEILPQRSEGEKLYRKHCADCHGIGGTGTAAYLGNHTVDLTDASWEHVSGVDGSMQIFLDDGLFGVHDEYGDELTDEQIRAVIDHLKTLRGES